jgi:hypothetical protein
MKTNNNRVFRRMSQNDNTQIPSFVPCLYKKKLTTVEDSPSVEKSKEIKVSDLKQILPPKSKLPIYQATPPITRKQSTNNTRNKQ